VTDAHIENAKRVRVKVTLTFDAYAHTVLGEEDAAPNRIDWVERVSHEICDAVEYRAPHLHDTEPGDSLIALVEGGSGSAVNVTDINATVLPGDPSPAAVKDAIEATAAWM
jgi:hypothetical protein